MATFMNRALAYLGLKDVDDDELYDDAYDAADELAMHRAGHIVYPDHDVPEPPEHPLPGTVRPLVREERDGTGSGPRAAIVRPLVPNRGAKVHVVAPARFSDAQQIGDLVKQNSPVIVNLQMSERDLARRMIDFCSGLTYALGGSMEKVADQVFLLTPSNVEVSDEERLRLQERGLFQPRA
jgi:cell division inhibitor SepF